MDAEKIEERLLMELRIVKGQDVFSGDSAVDLFLQIRNAARRMADEGATTEDDMTRAVESLHVFLSAMEAERDRLGLSEFREVTVNGAIQKLCPGFWPFC